MTTEGNGRPETFGTRCVFTHVDLSEISGQFRLNYTFTPNLTLKTYVEPFAASGRFHSFGELLAPRRRELLVYGSNGTTIVRNPDGTRTVTDGSEPFDIDNEGFNERRSARMPSSAGSGGSGVRSLSSGSRIAAPGSPSRLCVRATFSTRSTRAAKTFWR